MNVAFRQDATNDADAILRTDLENDLAYSQANIPAQNIITVLRRPDDVKAMVIFGFHNVQNVRRFCCIEQNAANIRQMPILEMCQRQVSHRGSFLGLHGAKQSELLV